MDKQTLQETVNQILDEMRERPIPLGVSSRHIHLSTADYLRLFPEQPISEKKPLMQPGQYAAEQVVTLEGPKGKLHNVRLLGPLRNASQVEISRTDARTLGITAPLRMSGDLSGTPGIRLISPFAELEITSGVIVAQRHIHMSPLDALIYGVTHGDKVAVAIEGDERRLIFENVAVRVSPDNPPCIVDETADIVKAAEDIINGASFDYNLPCIAEKSLIVVASVADYLIQQMQSFGALLLNYEQTEKLRAICLPDGSANKKLVGKSPSALLEAAGLPLPAKAPRLLIAVVDANDSWVTCEQLMPMLPIVKVNDFDSALTLALKVEDGLHHTAIMHSQNVSRLNLAARVMQTSIFVKNGPSWAGIGVGGEGFTTFTIATPTGEGTTSARTFARSRRCVLTSGFSIR